MKHLSLSTLSAYQIRRSNFENRPHIIAPVVLITEGVHCGSGGCAYYPAEELSSFPASWNGIPVPIYHPVSADGAPLSCNSPEVIEENNIGRLFNVTYADGKLKGEIWIDESKAGRLAPEVLSALNAGKILEVSTGLFADDEAVSGVWMNENYDYIVRNIRPDHLAILPGQTGACSVADGCGIRANKGGKVDINIDKKATILDFIANGRKGVSYEDRRRMIQDEMNKMDVFPVYNEEGIVASPYVLHYVIATYPGYFICVKETNDGSQLYKCSYTMNNDNIEISKEMKKVKEVTNYVEEDDVEEDEDEDDMMRNSGTKTEKKEVVNMEKCCPKKVDELIANTTNGFTEADKTWMLELSPEAFDRIVANTVEVKKEEPKKAETAEEVVANATDEMKAKVEAGLKMLEERKTALVSDIVANELNKFTKDELESKSITELEKISAFVTKPDFSGRGSATITNAGDTEVLELPKMTFEKK